MGLRKSKVKCKRGRSKGFIVSPFMVIVQLLLAEKASADGLLVPTTLNPSSGKELRKKLSRYILIVVCIIIHHNNLDKGNKK
jgi:hypothetical protein